MKRPWMPLYVSDFINSEEVIAMSDEACGVYIKLLCHNWEKGDLPSDPDLLAKMIRRNPRSFRRVWPSIQHLFPEYSPGRLGNERVMNERKSADQKSEKSAKAAIKRHSGDANALPYTTQQITAQHSRSEHTDTAAAPLARESFDFDAIYALYPRKGDGKAKGIERLKKQVKNADDYQQVLQAARHYAEKTQAEQTPLQYVKRFDTWCNGHWRDYVDGPHIVDARAGQRQFKNFAAPRPHLPVGHVEDIDS